MLHVFICEDDNRQRQKITDCISNYIMVEDLPMQVALSTGNPEALITYLQQHKEAGLYFLDYDLQHTLDGIKLAENIRKYDPRAFIVFITTHAEALPLTFKHKVEAMDYIIKDDIHGIEPRIVSCISDAYTKYIGRSNELQANFVFKMTEQRFISVPYDKIIYIETSPRAPRKVILHAVNGIYDFYGVLDEIEKQLDDRFFRCHKSFIVNTHTVEQVDTKEYAVHMRGGYHCFVSTRKAKALQQIVKKKSSE